MPYIDKKVRREAEFFPETAGELNYALTMLCQQYLGKKFNYQKLNDVFGALEGCKLELYRRLAVPYEDGKIAENGDVY